MKEFGWASTDRVTVVFDPDRRPPVSSPSPRVASDRLAVGEQPWALAFDGKYLWVAVAGLDSVSKIDVATDTVVAVLPVGTFPFGLAFDGASIWVANIGSHDVSKIDIRTNAVVATVSVGTRPSALAFDGSDIWVANNEKGTSWD